MRFSTKTFSYFVALATLINAIKADDIFDDIVQGSVQDAVDDWPEPELEPSSTATVEIEHPKFTPLPKPENAVFFEQFVDESAFNVWKPSNAKKNDEFSYVGKWSIEEPTSLPGFEDDYGLVVSSPAAHHAISAKFNEPLDNTDNTLVVQYEVKLQNGLECGGAYLKLLNEGAELHAEEFSSSTPYQVMFGPDRCGSTNKVHFIINRKNPLNGEIEEKHLALPPTARINKLTNLYTLIIKPDQDFEIRINGDVAKAGNLLDEGAFRPSFNPPAEIEDPDDTKPDDWVDAQTIPDPEQPTKPEDWDEDAPLFIADPDAVKPEDWDEDAEAYIPDPEADKPEDWDDEEDGEWVAPEVPNPVCEEISGCGPWTAPKIKNPDYKGPWIRPSVPNPDYKGPWKPRNIPNPDYFEDTHPSNLEPIGGVGFELWTMQNGILFDNIYIGHSIEEAESIGNATYLAKVSYESLEEQALAPEPTPKERKRYDSAMDFFKDDPIGYVVEVSRVFILNFSYDPLSALKYQPFVAAGFATAFTVLLAVIIGSLIGLIALFSPSSSPAPTPASTDADATTDSTEIKTTEKIVEITTEVDEVVVEAEPETEGASTATSRTTRASRRKA